jgi:putative Holliday junction resolvase
MIFKDITQFYYQIMTIEPKLLKAMGIDYGLKKTGIAISDNGLSMALPVCVINVKNQDLLTQNIGKLMQQYEIGFLVLGFPNAQYDSTIYQEFAQLLATNFNVPIYLQDETYTSRMADEMLKDLGLNRKRRNTIDDKISAKLILENFLEKINRIKNAKT